MAASRGAFLAPRLAAEAASEHVYCLAKFVSTRFNLRREARFREADVSVCFA